MKKLFIGLLVLAAAGTAFYLLNRKKENKLITSINKELLTGKWRTVLQEPAADSAKTLYQYEFQKEGVALRFAGDAAKTDSAYYEWNKKNELVWKEKPADTTGKIYTVVKLTADSLQLQTDKQTENILFVKVK